MSTSEYNENTYNSCTDGTQIARRDITTFKYNKNTDNKIIEDAFDAEASVASFAQLTLRHDDRAALSD